MILIASISTTIFWGGALLLIYVYWGYGVLLGLLAGWRRREPPRPEFASGTWPSVAVLLTVHNEERTVGRRLENLIAQDYPADRMEIVVASDGSTDRTEDIVETWARGRPVRLLRSARLGKSAAQNAAMNTVQADIVVLTDSEALFDPACIRAMVAEFAAPTVGCVTAQLRNIGAEGDIGRSQSLYWSYELQLRALESRLGILAVASGSAMALRRSLFRALPTFVGDDCIIPLEVVSQGYRVTHCSAALAYDHMPDSEAEALRTRTRMTMRNWTGTWLFACLLNPLRHPGYAFALWSHKLLRWLGSWVLVAMALAAAGMAATSGATPSVVIFAAFMAAGALGWWCARRGRSLPLAGTAYAFLFANLGFLLGIAKAARGDQVHAYRSRVGS